MWHGRMENLEWLTGLDKGTRVGWWKTWNG